MRQSLISLEAALRVAEFEAQVASAGPAFPVDQILIHLGRDEQERDYFMQLLFLRDLQQVAEVAQPLTEADGNLDFLQFYTALPVMLAEKSFPDLARLILIINKALRVGNFGLHEADNQGIFLRHILMLPDGQPQADTIVRIVETLADYVDDYADVLEQVGTGAITLTEVLSNCAEAGANNQSERCVPDAP